MSVDSITAMLSLVALVMISVATGFCLCYFLVKHEDKNVTYLQGDYETWMQSITEDSDKDVNL